MQFLQGMFKMKKQKTVYLDNAATTPLDKEVLKEMLPFLKGKYGNPSSIHSLGEEAKKAVEKARKQVAKLINAESNEIIFTSCGTEANNLALKGIDTARVFTSSIEHAAVLETARAIEKPLEIIPVDRFGIINMTGFRLAITKNALVSIMHVNNEIGTIQPIEEIAGICKANNCIFHTDAVQSLGKIPIDVKKLGIDMLSGSGHKINGPKGVGFLYIKKELKTKLQPLLNGGGQESGLRSGTENVAGIVALGKACELAGKKMKQSPEILKLRDFMLQELLEIPGVKLNGSSDKRIFNNINIAIKDIEGEALVLMLNQSGIACSTASACTSLTHQHSHVLKAIGLSQEEIHSTIRISLGYQTTKREIDYALARLKENIIKLRKISGK
jgi:cysteine desulfurase